MSNEFGKASRERYAPKRAISIRQPYAEAILRGIKKFEYRGRPTKIRERVYIYAALTPGDEKSFEKLRAAPGDLPTGVLVGTVEIAGCRHFPDTDEYGYELRNPERIDPPIVPKKRAQPCWFFPF